MFLRIYRGTCSSEYTEGHVPQNIPRDMFLRIYRGTCSSEYTEGHVPQNIPRDMFLRIYRGTCSSEYTEGHVPQNIPRDMFLGIYRGTCSSEYSEGYSEEDVPRYIPNVGLDSDIGAMLGHLKMPKLLTMAYPTYRDVSCQFLSSLEVTYHDAPHVRQGWGKIKFKINGREYNMNFKDIGRVMGFQDLADYSLPKCENLPTQLWKLITGNKHFTGADKNSHIRHPSVRYLHRMFVHAFYPRKQAGNVTEEDIRLICPAIRPCAPPGTLPLPSNDIYASFGMVSFFVNRLEHYRDWAWSVPTRHDFTEPPRKESVPIYGSPRYYFKPHDGVLPPG
uniref:Arabidopsis retrotransposon Orf1 C-terminal domain-containing protein n=1 Tax=Brassica oleracea var. oleracea TaxID=109376 RepID=A0A0D2ZVF0_BRAOL